MIRHKQVLVSRACYCVLGSHNEQGVSIVEILLVTTLVGLIVLFIANLPQSIHLISFSQRTSLAKQIATKQIEKTRSQPFASLANGVTSVGDSRLANLGNGSGSITIASCPPAVCPNPTDPIYQKIKQITVVISWNDKGKNRSIQIITLLTDGGLK